MIPYSAVQLIGIGTLMEGMSGGAIPFMAGLLIATFVAIIWAYIEGMRAVAWTDSLQALIMLIVSSVSVLWGLRGLRGASGALCSLKQKCPEWLAVGRAILIRRPRGLALPWFLFPLNPQVSQRSLFPLLGAMRTMVMGFMVFGLSTFYLLYGAY